MPHRFKTSDGVERKPGEPFPLALADGTTVEGIWGGCAQYEKCDWWLRKEGNQLAQSPEVSQIGIKGEDDDVMRWGRVPSGVHLLFVLEPPKTAKAGHSYRVAKMITIPATPEQFAFFRDERFSLLGILDTEGNIKKIPPLLPPPPEPPKQGELF